MSLQTTILTKKEIEEIVKNNISKELSVVYSQLQKLRNEVIDLNDVAKVLARSKL